VVSTETLGFKLKNFLSPHRPMCAWLKSGCHVASCHITLFLFSSVCNLNEYSVHQNASQPAS